jgi:hypothetical protein
MYSHVLNISSEKREESGHVSEAAYLPAFNVFEEQFIRSGGAGMNIQFI